MRPDAWRQSKRYAQVLGHRMAYIEQGQGSPIVFLHGNPTSSWLWRSVIAELAGQGRCIAPDLIGMGDSAKLPPGDRQRYTFARHRDFLDGLLEGLGVGADVTLIVHDWGSALGFDWARRHPGSTRAIAYMEAIVRPFAGWEDWPEAARSIFQRLRSPAGEQMILDGNVFVERILPAAVLRQLSDEEMDEYRRPFAAPGEDRLPTLTWPRQIPIAGEPADVAAVCSSTPLPAASWSERNASSAEPGPARAKSPSPACTSSRKTPDLRSARPSPAGSPGRHSHRKHPVRPTATPPAGQAGQNAQRHRNGTLDRAGPQLRGHPATKEPARQVVAVTLGEHSPGSQSARSAHIAE